MDRFALFCAGVFSVILIAFVCYLGLIIIL